MSSRETYSPGPADAQVKKDGDKWTLVLSRTLKHSPKQVWDALTDPEQLREWAPFDADRNLGAIGPVKLTTVGTPNVSDTAVIRADTERVLEYQWGGNDTRWELEEIDGGTKLTLWAKIDRRYVAMGAAGWHICIDVLDHLLDGDPMGRIVAGDALEFKGWQRLNKEYASQFGVEAKTPLGDQMAKTISPINFKAKLHRPAGADEGADWTFLHLPQDASQQLPSRSMVSVDGAMNGSAFQTTLIPDGEGGHWMKVNEKLRAEVKANVGDVLELTIAPVTKEPEPEVPDDVMKALEDAGGKAVETWNSITPVARRDWIFWIVSGRKAETRLKRIQVACSKLSAGNRRPCCFDRSGMYDKSLSCPIAEDE